MNDDMRGRCDADLTLQFRSRGLGKTCYRMCDVGRHSCVSAGMQRRPSGLWICAGCIAQKAKPAAVDAVAGLYQP